MKIRRTEDPRFAVLVGQKLFINIDNDGYKTHLADRENFIKMKKAVADVEKLTEQVNNLSALVQQLVSTKTSGIK